MMEYEGKLVNLQKQLKAAEIVINQIRSNSNPSFLKRLADEYKEAKRRYEG